MNESGAVDGPKRLRFGVMGERIVVRRRVATNHQLDVYGGIRHSDELLGQLAEAIRKGELPMVIDHDHARTLDARCLQAEVVDLDDGHKAVEAEYAVDRASWEAFQNELCAKGVRGGNSFTYGLFFSELLPCNANDHGKFQIVADAGYFAKRDLEEAGDELVKVGTVRLGLLYQFEAHAACRIIVEYVQAAGGVQPSVETVLLSIVGTGIYQAITRLLHKLKASGRAPDTLPQIEIHTKTSPDGQTEQKFLLRTDNHEVLKQAVDRLALGIARPEFILIWDQTRNDWTEPTRIARSESPTPGISVYRAASGPDDDDYPPS